MSIFKLDAQFLMVKFPIIFPIFYGLILFLFPQFETELIFFTILLLAETHFGATWPFLIDKANYPFIKKNKVSLITIPIFIIVLSFLGFFFINKLFLLIFFAANIYHVTRQSFGIGKLYCNDHIEKKYQEVLIYITNFIYFIIGFFRFYLPFINENNIFLINIFVLMFLIVLFMIYLVKFGFSENFLIFTVGCLIFYPICFVSNPVHAIIMGVTMHYTQYIYLTFNVIDLRNQDINVLNKSFFSKKIFNYLIIVVSYSLVMTLISLFGKYEGSILKSLIVIPIIGQMLHFYLDSQLWKFSDKYNRDNTLFHITRLIK